MTTSTVRPIATSAALVALAALAALALAAGATPERADGSHNIYRGISIKYEGGKFKGRIKSEVPVCLPGEVTVRKLRPGPDRVVGSATASASGRWSLGKRARRGRFYAETGSYESTAGLCRAVRSRVIRLR